MTELSDKDVKMLFAEGYYVVECDACGKPVGCIRVLNGYDYTYDETLCFDCAKAKAEKMKFEQDKIYG